MRSFILLVFILGFLQLGAAQHYLPANEKIIVSFTTDGNKKLILSRDSSDKYIIYRVGTADKTEFTFPEKLNDSWDQFTYSCFLRGGGKENEGLDLNYVCFIKGTTRYVIYHTYSAAEGKSRCGLKVTDTTTQKTVDIPGDIRTLEGNLMQLRDNTLLKTSAETFD